MEYSLPLVGDIKSINCIVDPGQFEGNNAARGGLNSAATGSATAWLATARSPMERFPMGLSTEALSAEFWSAEARFANR